jgi:histidinol-phosphate/aromatic aminotransferase/cobyric acid decarboxylase-like protein
VIGALNAVRVPWSASSIAQSVAIAALSVDAEDHVRTTTAALRFEALRLRASLDDIGYETTDSATHFFLIRVRNGADARQLLLDRAGILVRDCTSFGLADWIRVAAQRPHANDDLLHALRDLSPQLLPRVRATSGRNNR